MPHHRPTCRRATRGGATGSRPARTGHRAGWRTFLRLLLDEAPAAAIEDELREARERGLDATDLERLAEAGYLAVQLRLVLRERRRRETELAALFATAGDLIAIRDPQRVLQAVARRARQLLEADTAYLTSRTSVGC